MKGFQKLTLAAAIAAAPFAQAMESMDDALLSEMTGQAGITIDVDLQMSIAAIKYVDQDGVGATTLVTAATGQHDNTGTPVADGGFDANGDAEAVAAAVYGTQGAISLVGLTVDNDGAAARIRGVTIDVDGTNGIVLGLNEIGDELGNGIDITVDAILINNGNANLNAVNAVNSANAGFNVLADLNYADYASGAATTAVNDAVTAAAGGSGGAADELVATDAGYPSFAALVGAAAAGDTTAQGLVVTNQGASVGFATAAGTLADAAAASAVGTEIASAGNGNIGGIKIENFRNYLQDSLVAEYNGVFDMALMDSSGSLTGAGGAGRFVRGEIVVNGTGNAAAGTSGLAISGEFGGGIDQLAWVDEGNEVGVADLGFFNGVDTDGDSIADTIEGMHFSMNIDAVQYESWNAAVPGTNDVVALQISGLKMEGTIMMGSIYMDGDNTVYDTDGITVLTANTIESQSLGSVLIKDIDMTGTSIFVYGH